MIWINNDNEALTSSFILNPHRCLTYLHFPLRPPHGPAISFEIYMRPIHFWAPPPSYPNHYMTQRGTQTSWMDSLVLHPATQFSEKESKLHWSGELLNNSTYVDVYSTRSWVTETFYSDIMLPCTRFSPCSLLESNTVFSQEKLEMPLYHGLWIIYNSFVYEYGRDCVLFKHIWIFYNMNKYVS